MPAALPLHATEKRRPVSARRSRCCGSACGRARRCQPAGRCRWCAV